MTKRRIKPRRHKKRLPFWKAVKHFGFRNALSYELRNPRRYPRYPIWFNPMLISMVILATILYFYPIDYIPILFYILEIIVVSYMMFRLIKRLDRIRIKGSLLSLWGLRLLSGVVSAFGLYILLYVYFTILIYPFISFLGEKSIITYLVIFGYQWNTPFITPLALEVIGVGLCLIGAYLLFKFQMKSGNIIWIGRI